jgi:DNA-binding MarR family transcriptional regulator
VKKKARKSATVPSRERAGASVLNLSRYATYYLHAISNKLTSGASRLYLRHFDVGIIEWRVVGMLAVEPGITANRVSHTIGFDKAAISRAIRALEAKGCVRVVDVPGDARQKSLRLTSEGYRLHDRILEVALERERRLLSDLMPQEVDTLLDLLARINTRMSYVNQVEPSPTAARRPAKRRPK